MEKFLPLTRKVLGEEFANYFRDFSQTFNPQSSKKHFEDAFYFCRFLRNRNIADFAKSTAEFEKSKLEFFGLEKRLVVCRLDYDVRSLFDTDQSTLADFPQKRKLIVVWLRIGKRVRQYFF